jgi:hypothetical protein
MAMGVAGGDGARTQVVVVVGRPLLEQWELLCIERLAAAAEVTLVDASGDELRPRRRAVGSGMRRRIALAELAPRWPVVAGGTDLGRQLTALGAERVLLLGTPPAVLPATLPVWCFRIGVSASEPLFWEALRGAPTVTAQLVACSGPVARVLREGVFGIAPRRQDLRRTLDNLLDELAYWPALAVQGVGEATATLEPLALEEAMPAPAAYHRMAYAGRAALIHVRRVQRALTEHAQWRVGLVETDVASFCLGAASPPPVRWLELPAQEVAADPFVVGHDGGHVVMYERLDAVADRKVIWWARVEDGQVRAAAPAEGLPDYASYPNTFRLGDELFCLPEAHREGELALYRARAFPWSWEKVEVLVPGRELLDPTLTLQAGRWWLFCTDRRRGPNYNLSLWHAERLSGPWREHPANPVRTDIRGARPAGPLFTHGGRLYRPAQDCSIRYGRRVTVQEVLQLDPERFHEVPAAIVEPPDRAFADGIHTVCGVDGITVIDGRRTRFRLPLIGRRLATARRQWALQWAWGRA